MKKIIQSPYLKAALLFLVLFTLAYYGHARAGGGGGGGRGGGFGGGFGSYSHYGRQGWHSKPLTYAEKIALVIVHFLGFIFVAFSFLGFGILVTRQVNKTRKSLQAAAKFDAFWNEEKMITHTKEVFLKIQEAWTQRELKNASELVTPKFIAKFQPLLNIYKRKRIVNITSNISFSRIAITKIHDSENNEEDMFKAFIRGFMKDYFVSDSNFTATMGRDQASSDFEDVYVFVRSGNSWKLDNIINDPENKDLK